MVLIKVKLFFDGYIYVSFSIVENAFQASVSVTLHDESWLRHFSCEVNYSFTDDSIPFTNEGCHVLSVLDL